MYVNDDKSTFPFTKVSANEAIKYLFTQFEIIGNFANLFNN